MAGLRKYGLIGFPIEQSFSPAYFEKKFKRLNIEDANYKSYAVNDLSRIWRLLPNDILGFNVTIPHKEAILPYLDLISKEAKALGAVNTVKKIDGLWKGFNTDVYGFELAIRKLIGKRRIRQAMVLGNGGSAKAVKHVLKKLGIRVNIISRKKGFRGYKNLTKEFVSANHLIINTTPLGMGTYKDDKPAIPYNFLNDRHLLFDLVYNPQKTLFLKEGEWQGAKVMNGLEMLHLQADKAWQIWNSLETNR